MTAVDVEITEPLDPAPDPAPDHQEPDNRVVLFRVNGRDYLVDAEPDASALLRFMWNGKTDEMGAICDLLVELLGEDEYLDLADTKGISPATFQAIVGAAVKHLTGGSESAPKGPQNRAARRSGGGNG